MRFLLIIFVVLLFSVNSNAQKILERQDGSVEVFQDIHEESGRIYIKKLNQPTPIELDRSGVMGYYDQEKEIYFFFMAGQFMERVLEGKIDAYSRTVTEVLTTATGSEYKTTIYLYLDKGGKFFETLEVSEAQVFGKLREIFADDEELMSELESMTSIKYKPIYNMVKKYNLKHYEAPDDYAGKMGKVVFQRKKRGQAKEPVTVSIGSEEYTLDLEGEATVELPTNVPVKVCVGSECELISGLPTYARNFEVSKSKKGKYSIDKK